MGEGEEVYALEEELEAVRAEEAAVASALDAARVVAARGAARKGDPGLERWFAASFVFGFLLGLLAFGELAGVAP